MILCAICETRNISPDKLAQVLHLQMAVAAKKYLTQGTMMQDDPTKPAKQEALSFECNSCGQFFESWERLRQHAVDCADEDTSDNLL